MSASRKAIELLADHGVDRPPVDVEHLAKQLGLGVTYERLDRSVSGMLVRSGAKAAVIAVNAGHAPVRQRFTIAHELGHFLLHKGRPVIVDHLTRVHVNLRDQTSSLATSREEIQANQFAASLLMPEDWVAEALEDQAELAPARLVSDLATAFDVSEQAMEYRLINLGLRATP